MSYDDLPLFAEPSPRPQATIVCDDVLAWSEKYDGPKFHALLTDCPYHLISDTRNGSQRQPGPGPYGRHKLSTKGFMQTEWDGNDISFRPDTWKALAQHLLPGAFIMAFGSARTYHRLACALEDAGLIIHPALGFLQGQGFPKASRIDSHLDRYNKKPLTPPREFQAWLATAIKNKYGSHIPLAEEMGIAESLIRHWVGKCGDQDEYPTWDRYLVLKAKLALGDTYDDLVQWAEAEREVIGREHRPIKGTEYHAGVKAYGRKDEYDLTAPATPLAKIWAGHRYGMQAMKPAIEFIALAQKPYQGKPVDSITRTGAGALNIEASRIGWDAAGLTSDRNRRQSPRTDITGNHFHTGGGTNGAYVGQAESPSGRWPANFCLLHTEQCIRVGARQVKGGLYIGHNSTGHEKMSSLYSGGLPNPGIDAGYTDAHRNETVAAWQCAPGCVVAKLDAQAGERKSGGRTTHAGDEMHGNWRVNEGRTDARRAASDYEQASSTGHASRFFMTADWSLDIAEHLAKADPVFYAAKASRLERDAGLDGVPLKASGIMQDDAYRWEHDGKGNKINLNTKRHNPHPCVKPLKLCQWLATLLLPPAAYAPRRLLVPFAGSGSECIAASCFSGWEEVLGIESDPQYVEIARQRLAYWQQHPKT